MAEAAAEVGAAAVALSAVAVAADGAMEVTVTAVSVAAIVMAGEATAAEARAATNVETEEEATAPGATSAIVRRDAITTIVPQDAIMAVMATAAVAVVAIVRPLDPAAPAGAAGPNKGSLKTKASRVSYRAPDKCSLQPNHNVNHSYIV